MSTINIQLQQQARAATLKGQVCQLLNWTEEEYAQFQYTTGIAYLMWYLPCDESMRSQLERSKIFWNWFKNLWLFDDESYLSYKLSLAESSVEMRRMIYNELHDARVLAVQIKPNYAVWQSLRKKEVAV